MFLFHFWLFVDSSLFGSRCSRGGDTESSAVAESQDWGWSERMDRAVGGRSLPRQRECDQAVKLTFLMGSQTLLVIIYIFGVILLLLIMKLITH